MALLARRIAGDLGLSEQEIDAVEMAATLHDVGMINMPETLLDKRGKLTDAEYELIKTHTSIGRELLKSDVSPYLKAGALVALNHHERYDGSGYPNHLAGDEIPLAARIVAVIDVFDALTSRRAYKEAWSCAKAVEYITSQRGRAFDPHCVDAFNRHIERVLEGASRQLLHDID
jgi:two-component system response regulator RpfG